MAIKARNANLVINVYGCKSGFEEQPVKGLGWRKTKS